MRKTFTFLLSLTFAIGANAQQIQKCCNTTNSSFLLGSADYARHNQGIYIPSDFNDAVAGNITHIYYRYGSSNIANGNSLTEVVISLAQSTQTSHVNDLFITDGLMPVFTRDTLVIAPGVADQWFVLPLDVPFAYDPTRSLIVDIRFDESVTTMTCRSNPTPPRKLATGDPLSAVGTTTSTNLHDIGFDLDNATGIGSSGPIIFTTFPNPANDRIEVALDRTNEMPVEVKILDASGRTVTAQKFPSGSDR